jgi:hypothetical protein
MELWLGRLRISDFCLVQLGSFCNREPCCALRPLAHDWLRLAVLFRRIPRAPLLASFHCVRCAFYFSCCDSQLPFWVRISPSRIAPTTSRTYRVSPFPLLAVTPLLRAGEAVRHRMGNQESETVPLSLPAYSVLASYLPVKPPRPHGGDAAGGAPSKAHVRFPARKRYEALTFACPRCTILTRGGYHIFAIKRRITGDEQQACLHTN